VPEAGQIVDRCAFLTLEDAGGFGGAVESW